MKNNNTIEQRMDLIIQKQSELNSELEKVTISLILLELEKIKKMIEELEKELEKKM